MDTLMEFSIQGDIFFFYDTLSDEEKETVRKCMREKYKGHIVANPKIDEFLEGLERDHGIKLKRLSVTSVIAVWARNRLEQPQQEWIIFCFFSFGIQFRDSDVVLEQGLQ